MRDLWVIGFLCIVLASFPTLKVQGRPSNKLLPPTEVEAVDVPNDSGDAIVVKWNDSLDPRVLLYEVFWSRSRQVSNPELLNPILETSEKNDQQDPEKYWQTLGIVDNGEETKVFSNAKPGVPYYFKVLAKATESDSISEIVSGQSSAQWFDHDKFWILVVGGTICAFIIFFIQVARSGRQLFVRKIAGLDALDEAVGRATEMGRPVVFVPGIMDLDNVQTLAGLTLLGYVSQTIAEYDAKLDVPVSRSLVMTTGREVVRQAYLKAGRPEAYNDDMVHYLTDEQFGYVAGVNGMLLREKPATCLYMGAFFAESLLLAETGNRIGAIQIAGTAMPSQLPFFVAACDYTLIGEELFAASAYLSNDPRQLGSLKGQDAGKLIVMATILIGSLVATLALWTNNKNLQSIVDYLKTEIFV